MWSKELIVWGTDSSESLELGTNSDTLGNNLDAVKGFLALFASVARSRRICECRPTLCCILTLHLTIE